MWFISMRSTLQLKENSSEDSLAIMLNKPQALWGFYELPIRINVKLHLLSSSLIHILVPAGPNKNATHSREQNLII